MNALYINEAWKTLRFSLPFIANQLLQMSVVTIDTVMAGADGTLTLAAVSQGGSLWALAQITLIGIAMTLSPMVARAYVRKDTNQLRELFQQSLWLSVILSVFGVLLMLMLPSLMSVVKVDAAIIPPATDYLFVMTFAMPFFCFYLPIRFFNEGIGNPNIVMVITLLSIPINVGGNYILLNGLLGFPKMGAMGIAISSLAAVMFTTLLGFWYIQRGARIKAYRLFERFDGFRWHLQKPFFQLGIPNAVSLFMEAGMFIAVALSAGRMGVSTAAANQVAMNYISITFMIPLGLSLALMTRVGMAHAEDNPQKTRAVALSGTFLGGALMLFSVLAVAFFGKTIVGLYTDNAEVTTLALGLLFYATLFQVFDGIQVCSAGALRGVGDTKSPMNYAFIGYWLLGVPLAIYLAFYTNYGAKGLWVGLLIGLSVTGLLCAKKLYHRTA